MKILHEPKWVSEMGLSPLWVLCGYAVRTAFVVFIAFFAFHFIYHFIYEARHWGHYRMKSRQSEARQILARIHKAEVAFYHEHKRYGTFGEIGFTLPDHSNRYTYRIDNSGEPGTVFPAKDGTLTPDNTIVHAGISPDGKSFTATATANLDDDDTLDQWHVNDIKENLRKADVNDLASS